MSILQKTENVALSESMCMYCEYICSGTESARKGDKHRITQDSAPSEINIYIFF